VEVHNDLIVFVSCQINAEIISGLKCIDVVEVKEGVVPASKSKCAAERLTACLHDAWSHVMNVTNGCYRVHISHIRSEYE